MQSRHLLCLYFFLGKVFIRQNLSYLMRKDIIFTFFALLAVSFLFDKSISLFINNSSHILAVISLWSMNIINKFTIPIITILATRIKQWKIVIPAFFFLGSLFVILKFLIARARPFEILDIARISGVDYGFAVWNTSFPSWHVAALAMLIPFVRTNKTRVVTIYAVIILIAFSRLFAGIHYLSDVVVGFIIGLLIGELAAYQGKKIQKTNLLRES